MQHVFLSIRVFDRIFRTRKHKLQALFAVVSAYLYTGRTTAATTRLRLAHEPVDALSLRHFRYTIFPRR
jgi:hypothetical protein